MMSNYGYTYCKFFKTQQEMEEFVASFEDSVNDDEAPIGSGMVMKGPYRLPGDSFEFEVTDSGELEFENK